MWVTGASQGLGKVLAVELARLGARVILSSRGRDALEQVKAECVSARAASGLGPTGGDAHVRVLPLDLTSPAQEIAKKAEEADGFFGRVDVLIHNAGASQNGASWETQPDVDEQMMRLNVLGPMALTKASRRLE